MADHTDKNPDLKKEIEKSAKMFDVVKPGKTPPSSTSRPTIVGHTAMIKQDPMVRGSEDSDDSAASHAPLKSHSASKDIAPAEHAVKREKVIEPESPHDESEPDENKPKPEEPGKQPEKEEASEPDDSPPADGAVNALANEVTAKREEQKLDEELQAKYDEVEKSIEKREYFVPIGQVSRRRSEHRMLIVLLLVIILSAAALNFLIDAEIIDIGIKPLTNLL
jgi:hypothetical protein